MTVTVMIRGIAARGVLVIGRSFGSWSRRSSFAGTRSTPSGLSGGFFAVWMVSPATTAAGSQVFGMSEIRITRSEQKAGDPICGSLGPVVTRDGEVYQIVCDNVEGHRFRSHYAWDGFGARFYWDDDGKFAVLPVGNHLIVSPRSAKVE